MRRAFSWLISSILMSVSVNVMATTEKPVLTVYTYDAFAGEWGPGPKIKAEFEKTCGCELKFVALEDGVAILNRLKLEAKHNKADVALGMDEAMLNEAEKSHLFTPSHISLEKVNLPGGWKSDTFVPFDYGYFAFVYDSSKLKTPPASLQALIEHPELKIIYEDPRTSTPGQGLLLWIKQAYGDHADDAWQKLAKQTVTVTKGWSEAYGMFLQGQADMVLSYTTSPAYHRLAEQKNQYQAAMFHEGHLRQVEVAAQLKDAPQPKLAKAFLDFMLSDNVQSMIPTGNWMYPVTNVALPEGFNLNETPASTLKIDTQDWATHRKAWIQEWLQAVSH